jgi:Zn-dependent peptidase ImmA (M78 family)/DNA-binding Xre family transcriptional regulator
MVALVREAKGWSQRDLARESGVSQGYLSKVENGLLELTGDSLDRVAEVLDCPVALLCTDEYVRGIEVTCLHNRNRHSKLTVGAVKKIEAMTHLTRLTVERILAGLAIETEDRLERVEISEYGDPAGVARALRARWRLASGPIPNVVGLMEALGIIVVVRPMGTRAQDAVSTWPHHATHPPLMLINSGLSPDRQRLTICHELGHLVMHLFPGDNQEAEANQFAAELLTPALEIEPDLRGLRTGDFRRLITLKAHWKVSIGMLIHRAKDLGCISERQFKEFRIRLTRMGWHTSEPVDLPSESPSIIRRAIGVHLFEHGYTEDELAQTALMTPAAFRRHYLPDDPRSESRPALRLVTP